MNQKTRHFYSFGPFRLDARECLLNLDGKPVPLAPKAFEALLMLVENAGQLVDKDDLMRRLWPGTFVEEGNVAKHVSVLRKILCEATNGGEYIETIPKRGYRFVVEVRETEAAEAGSQPQTLPGAGMTGKKVSHYRVLQVLGGGGMGVVYMAEDLKLGRRVALKFLPEEIASDAKVLERFEREARAASTLDHPNICTIHEFGEHEGQPFIAMSLLEGQNLRDQIAARAAPFATDELLHLAIQIGDGLAAAHEKGIVHRDIKPANIFITNRSEVKILDFGLAKLAYAGDRETLPYQEAPSQEATSVPANDLSLSLTGVAMGTAPYMSPEQVRGEKLDARSDLFSFGLVIYEMATRKQAFSGDTAAALQEAILNRTPVPAKDLNPELPHRLEEIVNKALEKDREARYQTAEMCADLKRLRLDAEYSRRVFPSSKVAGTAGAVSPSAHTAGGGSTMLTLVKEHKWGLAAGLVLVGLLIGTVLHSTHSLHSTNISQATITHKQLTFSGNAYQPAISPDGLFVAYVSRKPNQEQTLMVQASNGAELEIARGPVISYPRWSPDGSEVLFYRLNGVSVVSRLGGVVRPISTGQLACWLASDGSQVVTASTDSASGFKGFRLVNNLTGEVKEVRLSEYKWLVDVDCSARAVLILAVTKTSEKFQIRVFKPDGGEEHTLVEDKDEIYAARWSPAGDYIYYLHGKGSTQELSKLSVTRKHAEPAVLADGLQTGLFFTLSADGSRLAYTREDHPSNLWRVTLPAAGKRAKVEISRLTSGTSYYDAPSFSPDGRWIAFALGPNEDQTNIFKMQLTGGEPVQVTFLEHASAASPAWSPDGQRLAFIGDQNGAPRVWMISTSGGTAQPVGHSTASDTNNRIVWWPSSDIVYQQSGVRNFLRINDKTHEETPIIQHDQSVGWVPARPVFSPDGKKMAIEWNRKDAGLWIISLEPYSETLLQSGLIQPIGWSPDGKYVYAIRGRGLQEIIRVQVATPNEVTSVTTLPGDVAGMDWDAASVSPDGKEIVVSVSEHKSDVWLMENFDPASAITHPIRK